MATYAIGDLQGCYEPLQKLLRQFSFDSARDVLWFVGDLVNRGEDSLACLRFVKSLGDRAVTVLGNHDLHLLCVAEGVADGYRGDTLQEILEAPDRGEFLDWLRHRPLLHYEHGYALVHAGLLPQWNLSQAQQLAREAEQALRGKNHKTFFAEMYGNKPDKWNEKLTGHDRLRVIINAMTRLRFCSADGHMDFDHKGSLENAPPGFYPWFEVPGRATENETIICGHWSALGLRVEKNLVALDSGCLWRSALSAFRLEDRAVFSVSCAEAPILKA
ncbi:MAG: symmetrical bis(5'-nucleosyl)-tetraphosphatase [Burkholderiales bacterium]